MYKFHGGVVGCWRITEDTVLLRAQVIIELDIDSCWYSRLGFFFRVYQVDN